MYGSDRGRSSIYCLALMALGLVMRLEHTPAAPVDFQAGFARRDITPTRPVPLWGYGARHAALSTGVRDRLYAKALVIAHDDTKLALVGLDLGRAPRDDMLVRIREAVLRECGVNLVMIVGSHTHHGPVIELLDQPGKGQGTFDDAVAYASELEQKIVLAIGAASAAARPARIGWAAKLVDMNRNRHTKRVPKPVDPELGVIRFDDREGQPIGLVVNFAAHPTMLPADDLRISADWPGQMMQAVEEQLQTNCLFMQGAAGDLSPKTTEATRGVEAYGAALAAQVVELAGEITTAVPAQPRLEAREEVFEFSSRMPLDNPLTEALFGASFFPELAAASLTDALRRNQIRPRLTVVLINRELALVGGSGEFFNQHAVRLKQRASTVRTFFFGYCNGHHMYLPTIEGAAEGGYGADPLVSWVALGAGEQMMDRALIHIHTLLGRFQFQLPF